MGWMALAVATAVILSPVLLYMRGDMVTGEDARKLRRFEP